MKKQAMTLTLVIVSWAFFAGVASAGLSLKLDGHEIYTFEGNFYTYYGTYEGTPGQVGFGIEAQGTSSPFFAPTDPQNYGLVVSGKFSDEIPGTFTYLPPLLDAPVAAYTSGTSNPPEIIGSAEWALSYSGNNVNPVPNPHHSVLFGDLAPLFADGALVGPGQELNFHPDNDGPGKKPDRLDLMLTLETDPTHSYHSVHYGDLSLVDLSNYLNETTGSPGILTLSGIVYEIDEYSNGRNVWSTVKPVPEPTSLAIFGIGALCMGAGAARRRRKEKQAAEA
ncbi:MAG: hypothetical protein COA78_37830 [Blastopirellula sp.]|nr:MAG: hypothetical protein COA78_37830 [Blastopirellula sp.]